MKTTTHKLSFLILKEMRKYTIIKIAFCLFVFISSLGLQSCQKENEEIVPVKTNLSVIGKWRAVKGTTTIEREFIKGPTDNKGTGHSKETTVSGSRVETIINATFDWEINETLLHFRIVADEFFIFKITENGNRLILFDEVHRDRVLLTFERVNP